MWQVRVKDRGRSLVYHNVEQAQEALELRRVYELLGYAGDKIEVETLERPTRQAA